jgi:hypothetical protein
LIEEFEATRSQTQSMAEVGGLLALYLRNESVIDSAHMPDVLPALYMYQNNMSKLQTKMEAFGALLANATSTKFAAEVQSLIATASRRLEFIHRWYEQLDLVRRLQAQRELIGLQLDRLSVRMQQQEDVNASLAAVITVVKQERSSAAYSAMGYLHAKQRAFEYWSLESYAPPASTSCGALPQTM